VLAAEEGVTGRMAGTVKFPCLFFWCVCVFGVWPFSLSFFLYSFVTQYKTPKKRKKIKEYTILQQIIDSNQQ
jgi:ABC-type Fe3+ transport system permease subunit